MEHLDYFIAIAEEQNLSRAAKRLYISQPALTRFVNNLEAEYGVKFFDRTKLPITLTAAGQLFLQEKIRLDNREQGLRLRLAELNSSGIRISIGTGQGRTANLFPPLIRQFTALHPEVTFTVKSAGERELPSMLDRQQLDFIFGVFDPIDGMQAEWRYATVERIGLFAPLSYGLLPAEIDPANTFFSPHILKPEQLNGLPQIAPHNSLGSSINYQLMLNQFNIRPGKIIRSENSAFIRNLVKEGVGFSFCAYSRREDLMDQNGIYVSAVFNLPGLPVRRTSIMAYRKDHPHLELLRSLANTLEQQIQNSTAPNTIYWKSFSP